MSRPKPSRAAFTFYQDGEAINVVFHFNAKGLHSFIQIIHCEKSTRIENARGEYKPRVTDCLRLIEQTANGKSTVYRGRQRASRAAKRVSIQTKFTPATVLGLKVFGVGDE